MPEMRELMNDGRVHLVQGPMCHWRLASTGDGNEQGFVCGKTRWATRSSMLATMLAREHAGENRRVRLIGWNETIAGSMYSPRLVNEVLRALGKQLVDDGRLDSVSLYSAGWTDSRLSRVGHTRMARGRLRSARKFARSNQSQGRKKRRNRVGVEAEAL